MVRLLNGTGDECSYSNLLVIRRPPESKCYFATYSETRNLVSWQVSQEKWHNNKYTERVIITNGDKNVRVLLSSHLGLWTTTHVVRHLPNCNKLEVKLIYLYLVCCLQTHKIQDTFYQDNVYSRNIFCS